MRVTLTAKSSNRKTGPIPVSTTTPDTCPDVCPFKNGGCYAKVVPLAIVWGNVERKGDDWGTFCSKVAAMPDGQLWRHNQAGDLPGENGEIDAKALRVVNPLANL